MVATETTTVADVTALAVVVVVVVKAAFEQMFL